MRATNLMCDGCRTVLNPEPPPLKDDDGREYLDREALKRGWHVVVRPENHWHFCPACIPPPLRVRTTENQGRFLGRDHVQWGISEGILIRRTGYNGDCAIFDVLLDDGTKTLFESSELELI